MRVVLPLAVEGVRSGFGPLYGRVRRAKIAHLQVRLHNKHYRALMRMGWRACRSVAAASSAPPCQRPPCWGLGGGGVPRAPSSDSGLCDETKVLGLPSPRHRGLSTVANLVEARTAVLDRFQWPAPWTTVRAA